MNPLSFAAQLQRLESHVAAETTRRQEEAVRKAEAQAKAALTRSQARRGQPTDKQRVLTALGNGRRHRFAAIALAIPTLTHRQVINALAALVKEKRVESDHKGPGRTSYWLA